MPRGRPKGSKSKYYSYEFKLRVVKDREDNHLSWSDLEKKYGVANSVIRRWIKLYYEGVLETGKTHNRGNRFAALYSSKSLSKQERLELENLKLRIENERLKKGYTVKGGGAEKEYVSIFDANMKSSGN